MSAEVLRIAVYGPESTGKTQLATKLAAHFRAPLVSEYAREFWDAHGVIALEDMVPIAREQWRREDEAVARGASGAAGQSNLLGHKSVGAPSGAPGDYNLIGYKAEGRCVPPLVICDTEALTTMLWSDLLYGTTPDEVRRGAEKRCRSYALYLLLDTDVPWAADPQRCFPNPDDREKCRRIWHGALERRHLPYVWIRGDWAERDRAAIAAVEDILARR